MSRLGTMFSGANDELDKLIEDITGNAREYWGQFESEDAYKDALASKRSMSGCSIWIRRRWKKRSRARKAKPSPKPWKWWTASR